jgi:N-acetylglucosamine-6-phosphate deacetylase
MIIKKGSVYTEEGVFSKQDISVEGEFFSDCANMEEDKEELLDAEGLWVIPGLTDIHFHGCVNYDLCDGTREAVAAMAEYELRNGITNICPATMTMPESVLVQIAELAAAYENPEGADLVGINMEGPFVSREKKGAQNENYIIPPSLALYHKLQEISGNRFRLVDIAPEEPGALEFMKAVKDEIVVSIAHTTADYDLAVKALRAGASHVTHLYNAMPPYSHRAPGVVGAASDSQDCRVELICDGIHVHPSVVRNTFRIFGSDRIVLVSDSMRATGLEDGVYTLGGQKVNVMGKLAVLEDGTIAGSVSNLMECVRICVKEMGIPLEQAVRSAAVNSAKAIGIYDRYGSITPGKYANAVLLDQELNIKYVILRGKIVK